MKTTGFDDVYNDNDDEDKPDLIGSVHLGHGFIEWPLLLSGAVGLNGGRHGSQEVRPAAVVPLCGLGGTHAQHELHVKHGQEITHLDSSVVAGDKARGKLHVKPGYWKTTAVWNSRLAFVENNY